LIRQRYDAYTLESCLQKAMGEHTMLGDLLKPCLIPAYDIQSNQAILFKSHDVKAGRATDYKAWQVSRATTAAPSYFEPMKLQDGNQSRSLIDGAMFARNPALCAFLEAQEAVAKPHHTKRNIVMLSLGTGDCLEDLCHQSMREKGAIGWLKPMIEIMLHSGADIVDTQLKQLFQSLDGAYHRINPGLGQADDAMDNVSRDNLLALHEAGLKYVEDHKEQLEGIVTQLVG
jgi:patatin-like phospholipase/acyl hydrolase